MAPTVCAMAPTVNIPNGGRIVAPSAAPRGAGGAGGGRGGNPAQRAARLAAITKACSRRHCQTLRRPGSREAATRCLFQNASSLSSDCSKAVTAGRGSRGGGRRRWWRLSAAVRKACAEIMNPSAPFILRPVATSLLMIAIMLAGVVGFMFLPLSALPEVDYPTIQVQSFYPGASPSVMATSVTAVVERQFGQMAGPEGNVVCFLGRVLDRDPAVRSRSQPG